MKDISEKDESMEGSSFRLRKSMDEDMDTWGKLVFNHDYSGITAGIDPANTAYKYHVNTNDSSITLDDFGELLDLPHAVDVTVGDVNWKSMLKHPKKSKQSYSQYKLSQPVFNLKKSYSIGECLSCFNDVVDKNIGEIYLSGSVALYLQGKIKRDKFKDTDIVVVGKFSVDDDMYDYERGIYPPDPNGSEIRSMVFNDVPIDIITNCFNGSTDIEFIDVEYSGITYRCQDYKQIIAAKLRMSIYKMKDISDLIESSFEIKYK